MNVIQLISNPVWGGGESYALALCRRLSDDGHSVAVITRGKSAVDDVFRRNGFEPARLPLGGLLDFISPSRLSRVLDSIDGPVVVHVHNFKDARTAVAARSMCKKNTAVRIVVTRHLVKAGKTDRASRALYDAIDAIVFVSDIARREFLSPGLDIDQTKIHTVHNAVDAPTSVDPMPKAADELRLVYAGRLDAEKGVYVLVEAMAYLSDLPNLRLYVAGTGKPQYVGRLTTLRRSLGLIDRIEFLGHLADVAPLMASADIAVCPSIARESFGLTMAEFMARGVAVVASDNGAQPELAENGLQAILLAPGNPRLLADAIRRLALDKELRNNIGQAAARRIASDFGYDRFYKQILSVYAQ